MTLPSGRRFPRKLSHNRRKRQHHLVDANQVRVRCHAAVRARLRESSACVRTWICPTPARQGSHCRSAGCTTSRSSRRCIAWLRRCDMVASRLHRTSGCPSFCSTPAHSGPITLPRAIPHMLLCVLPRPIPHMLSCEAVVHALACWTRPPFRSKVRSTY